jgi:hypothetical protein
MALVDRHVPDPSLDQKVYDEFVRAHERIDRLASQLEIFLSSAMDENVQLVETGSWIPTLVGAGSPTYVVRYGTYTRVGRIVQLAGKLSVTGVTTLGNSNEVRIDGLPFAVAEAGDDTQRASCVLGGDWGGLGSVFSQIRLRTDPATSLTGVRDQGSGNSVYWAYQDLGSPSFRFNFSISYISA